MSKLIIGRAKCPHCGYVTTTGGIIEHVKHCSKNPAAIKRQKAIPTEVPFDSLPEHLQKILKPNYMKAIYRQGKIYEGCVKHHLPGGLVVIENDMEVVYKFDAIIPVTGEHSFSEGEDVTGRYEKIDELASEVDEYGNLVCTVEGCGRVSCSGGNYYRGTGYWCLCTEHAHKARQGEPQPKMKDKAIEHEAARDKETGYSTQRIVAHALPLPLPVQEITSVIDDITTNIQDTIKTCLPEEKPFKREVGTINYYSDLTLPVQGEVEGVKEKALELRNKFRILSGTYVDDDGNTVNNYLTSKSTAKKAALICVDEILKVVDDEVIYKGYKLEFWQSVKKNINDIK